MITTNNGISGGTVNEKIKRDHKTLTPCNNNNKEKENHLKTKIPSKFETIKGTSQLKPNTIKNNELRSEMISEIKKN
jgi:hypothetical protein